MRRPAFALTLAMAATIALASAALGVGPGGWDHLGVGATTTTPSLNGAVYALNADAPGVLLVGGNFTSAGGNANASRVATWNGTAWGALAGTPISNGNVFALAYHDGKVYAGGTFVNAGGNPNADYLAVWNGSSWGPFCNPTTPGPAFGGSVSALQVIGTTLYVGGSFQDGAGIGAADYLLACDLITGVSSSTVDSDGDINGGVYALAADSNGTLYAGGQFSNMDTIPQADHVAAFDGSWHAMGSGTGPGLGAVDSYVRSLTASGTDVYIGTDSVNVAQIANADHVARWNGSAWSAVGSNTAGTDGWFPGVSFINALTTSGPMLFAAGSFQNANGVATADNIAYFDGATWRPIGSNGAGNGPMIANMVALSVFRSKLEAAGNFTSAGGDVRAQSLAAYALKLPDARIGAASAGPFSFNGVYQPDRRRRDALHLRHARQERHPVRQHPERRPGGRRLHDQGHGLRPRLHGPVLPGLHGRDDEGKGGDVLHRGDRRAREHHASGQGDRGALERQQRHVHRQGLLRGGHACRRGEGGLQGQVTAREGLRDPRTVGR